MLRFSACLSFITAGLVATAFGAEKVDAAIGVAKPEARFTEHHAAFLARAQAGPVGLVFIGDSITAGWKNAPAVWDAYFGPYQPANFGISSDQTQNVLWRIENGELDGISPRVVVLMIGTNNTGSHTAAEITVALERIISVTRQKLPETNILLLGIFPRGPRIMRDGLSDGWEQRMNVIREVNTALPSLVDGKRVYFLDIGPRFLDETGSIPNALMPDQLHLSPAGYQVWAEAMQPTLDALLR